MNSKILRSLSYGVYVVTAMDGDKPCGCTANSIMQITSSPATVAVSLNRDNYTNVVVKRTGRFAVSLLAEDSDPSIIGRFGFSSTRNTDKFEGLDHTTVGDLPAIADSCGYFAAKVVDTLETSTHTIFIGEIVDDAENAGRTPMTYAYYHNVVKGKTARNAPTFDAELDAAPAPAAAAPAEEAPSAGGAQWKCLLCGYVYDGDVPFEELPDDWTCPICCAPKSSFRKIEE